MTSAEAATGTGGREAAPAAPVLECRGLRRRFGQRLAVDGVGFRVDPGETYGLLEPNGAGKLAVLLGFAAVLLTVASWRLHRALRR